MGGRIDPLWSVSRPRWFPVEFGWAVGFSYQGMPEQAQPVRNVWAGNMAIRSSVFEAVGGFREDFGKVGDVARPEDTDLCLRAAGERGIWLYEPTGTVGHWIPRQRATFRYFTRRCYHEGQGKAALAALDGARRKHRLRAELHLPDSSVRSPARPAGRGRGRRLGRGPGGGHRGRLRHHHGRLRGGLAVGNRPALARHLHAVRPDSASAKTRPNRPPSPRPW